MRWPRRGVRLGVHETDLARALVGSVDKRGYERMRRQQPGAAGLPPWDAGGRGDVVDLYKRLGADDAPPDIRIVP